MLVLQLLQQQVECLVVLLPHQRQVDCLVVLQLHQRLVVDYSVVLQLVVLMPPAATDPAATLQSARGARRSPSAPELDAARQGSLRVHSFYPLSPKLPK